MRIMATAALAALLAAPATALAQQVGDPRNGRRLAEAWCSQCHLIGPGASGPTSDAVPTFPSVARMASTTGMSLRAFLLTPHPRMPNIQYSREELDDIVAYILSLRGR